MKKLFLIISMLMLCSFAKAQDNVVYTVQIAADFTPLSIETLRKIYPSNVVINNDLVDNIYRYTVGKYDTYEEALEAKNKMGVKGAFIVAFKDRSRVKHISEVYTK